MLCENNPNDLREVDKEVKMGKQLKRTRRGQEAISFYFFSDCSAGGSSEVRDGGNEKRAI